jgi:hypothetical protein
MTIRKSPSEFICPQTWRELYRAALFGANQHNYTRISAAEEAILARTRELMQVRGPEVEIEREELDEASYALRALRNAAKNDTAA